MDFLKKHATFENIATSLYGLSRSLFVYVKRQHFNIVDGMEDFVNLLIDEKTIGEEGFLSYKGLIPMSGEDRELMIGNLNSIISKGIIN